ncbi:MAG: hypothetical protein AVO33_11280 [delta proteobacterium ML8_F1]|nr:MAG: hypothetical protein AVO33_11280 [delta proteobacterium ML8_F1]
MQIALTNKLAVALGVKPPAVDESIPPLLSWTANWTRVWDNRRADDMLVLVNHATRFTVAIYEVKRKNLKDVEEKMTRAIENTLLSMNYNPELVEAYMQLADEVKFVKNSDRRKAAWVSRAGLECAFHVGREYNGLDKVYSDTVGVGSNYRIVDYSGNDKEGFFPYRAMGEALAKLTGKQLYKSRALEFEVTLDLEIYKARRRIIVPAQMSFKSLHRVLQYAYGWQNCHLYDFVIYDHQTQKPLQRLVPEEEDLAYDDKARLMAGLTLEDFFPLHKRGCYTYDFGDNWEHEIQLVRSIDDYDTELPYLKEAQGQTPPEDVGGVGGFLSFREMMLDENHPMHDEMKNWVGYWQPELGEFARRPRVIYLY